MERLVSPAARVHEGRRTAAPHLLEEVYNLEDALVVGGFVNTLLRNSDRVRIGCLAQLVNVIAPLVTNESGVLRQSTYYPYSWALRYARGRVLDLRVESATYANKGAGLQLWSGSSGSFRTRLNA
jgi:alpha-N-arabinofuranosidase